MGRFAVEGKLSAPPLPSQVADESTHLSSRAASCDSMSCKQERERGVRRRGCAEQRGVSWAQRDQRALKAHQMSEFVLPAVENARAVKSR